MTDILITLVLILLSAVFSGLTLALMTLGPHELKRKIELGDKNAAKIYPIRKRGNLLLVTLCLSNVAVNAALSIFLGTLAPGLMAGIIATGLITVFGEIAPQAIFSRFAMTLGAKSVWLVRIFLFVLYPVCAPLAWILDKVLGDELPTVYSKKELIGILEEHGDSKESDVQAHEERIARGALTYGQKKIADIMTPRSAIVSVKEDDVLTPDLIRQLTHHGYSRYPVFDVTKEKLVGVLYMYKLIGKNYQGQKAGALADSIHILDADGDLDHALDGFLKTRQHLYGCVNSFGDVMGILAIEDILEEIIGKEIVDEFDEVEDTRAFAKKQNK